MAALAPACHSVDHIAGLNFETIANAVGFSTVRKDVNPHGIGYQKNCEEFREMQIGRHAKYVGTIYRPRRLHSSLDGTL